MKQDNGNTIHFVKRNKVFTHHILHLNIASNINDKTTTMFKRLCILMNLIMEIPNNPLNLICNRLLLHTVVHSVDLYTQVSGQLEKRYI